MNNKEILTKCDHTLLKQTATWDEIKAICDDGMQYETASICIPPCYVKQAVDYIKQCGKSLCVCTVIGFPNGSNTTQTKVFETQDAIANGAEEIDMVINIGQLRAGNYDYVRNEIKEIKDACNGKILKVIIETSLLTKDEKIKMCEIVGQAGADFIKTSTGFSTSGATFEDIELFAKHIDANIKIKAAGGISSLEDAQQFINLGASRLGTSKVVTIVKDLNKLRRH